VLFTYAHRGVVSFYPVAALNAAMLLSIPSEGRHYLIDVFAGVPVALFAIAAIRGARLSPAGIMRARPAETGWRAKHHSRRAGPSG
jgi:PAP2 superfamily